MIVGIHQPHYFPWLGYFDKVAKVDKFVLMDEVQLEDKSYMSRNRFLGRTGNMTFLTITASKKGYREKKYNEIKTIENQKWQNKHLTFFKDTYKYSPYFREIIEVIEPIFQKEYHFLFEVTKDSIICCMKLLGIETEIINQSDIKYKRGCSSNLEKNIRRSNDVLDICLATGASMYLTGTGASLGFLNKESFDNARIPVVIQEYKCPVYHQLHSVEFIPNISALDLLFSCGIEKSREIFWNNVNSTHELKTS